MPTRRLNFGFGSEGDETAGGPALLLLCVAMRLLRVVAQRRCVLLYSAVECSVECSAAECSVECNVAKCSVECSAECSAEIKHSFWTPKWVIN